MGRLDFVVSGTAVIETGADTAWLSSAASAGGAFEVTAAKGIRDTVEEGETDEATIVLDALSDAEEMEMALEGVIEVLAFEVEGDADDEIVLVRGWEVEAVCEGNDAEDRDVTTEDELPIAAETVSYNAEALINSRYGAIQASTHRCTRAQFRSHDGHRKTDRRPSHTARHDEGGYPECRGGRKNFLGKYPQGICTHAAHAGTRQRLNLARPCRMS